MTAQFEGKVAIVTGGASGIGRALCEALSRRRARVIVADIDREQAQRVASAVAASGGRAHAAHVDVTRAEHLQKLVTDAAAEHGRLRIGESIPRVNGAASVGSLAGRFRSVNGRRTRALCMRTCVARNRGRVVRTDWI
jgi:NAD(P)-dependent dehydrogenase (short-subunit alcohol dehydrogenase family)